MFTYINMCLRTFVWCVLVAYECIGGVRAVCNLEQVICALSVLVHPKICMLTICYY